jgi:hypothetical protein
MTMKLPVVDKLLVLVLLLTVTLTTSARARNDPKGGHAGGQQVSHGGGSRVTFRGGHASGPRGYSQSHVAGAAHFRSPGAPTQISSTSKFKPPLAASGRGT